MNNRMNLPFLLIKLLKDSKDSAKHQIPLFSYIPIWFYSSLASVMTNKCPHKNLLENKRNKRFHFHIYLQNLKVQSFK